MDLLGRYYRPSICRVSQPEGPPPPRQLERTPPGQAEFVICDHTIEEAFRDLKSLLGLDRLMNKTQYNMEQLAALTMIAYAVGLLLGEALRDELYGPPASAASKPAGAPTLTPAQRKWQRYSGLLILLRHKLATARQRLRQLVAATLAAFAALVRPAVRTPV